jgi:hypothetical protein
MFVFRNAVIVLASLVMVELQNPDCTQYLADTKESYDTVKIF